MRENTLYPSYMAGPHQRQSGKPSRHPKHQCEQDTEAETERVVARRHLHPRHGPAGEIGDWAGKWTGVKQQRLRAQGKPLIRSLLLAFAFGVDRLDVFPFGCRQIVLRATALVGGKGISKRPRVGMPNPAFDSVLPSEG